MNYYLVAPAKTFHTTDSQLTYASPDRLQAGQIVVVPLGRSNCVGIVIKRTTKPEFETKAITSTLYNDPLPPHLVKAIFWISDYYRCPLATVIQAVLPRGITKQRRANKASALPDAKISPELPLNTAQRRAIKEIETNTANTILLHGITGSGKTNVYIALAQKQLAQGKSVIILTPEIALTSQLVRNFRAHFQDVTLLHSAQSESLRHQIWQNTLKNPLPQIVIGPRSALFAPVRELGLVIIDEAHEPAYQQDQNPKYFAPRLAATMAKTILGTATPLVNDYYISQQHHAVVSLDQLAVENPAESTTTIIDLKDRQHFTRNRLISNQLIESIQHSLGHHTQSLIFHNRRGTAPLTVCDQCGWQALCPNCFLPLVLHADSFSLRCHSCGHQTPVPTGCPDCHNASILHKGFGTKYLEAELRKLFPHARIARFDADTTADQQLSSVYDAVHAGEYDILIGTQMLAKGFDFPKLTTLGVVQADSQLALPDFSSEERTFQLLTQVIGRATRGHQNSAVFIQTYQPNHPVIRCAVTADYDNFYKTLIQKRRAGKLPPYSFLLKLSMTYKTEAATIRNLQKLYKKIIQISKSQQSTQCVVSPPIPAFHERSPSGYAWQILLRAKSRHTIMQIFDQLEPNPHLHFEFDPISLL